MRHSAAVVVLGLVLLTAACEPPVPASESNAGQAALTERGAQNHAASPSGEVRAPVPHSPAVTHAVMPVILQGDPSRSARAPIAGAQWPGMGGSTGTDAVVGQSAPYPAPYPGPNSGPDQPVVDPATCSGIVTEDGGQLVLDGEQVFLFGLNVPFLLDNELPEESAVAVVEEVARLGVNTIRVWYFHNESAERFERLLDLGRLHGLRFVVVFEDNVFIGRDWFFSDDDEDNYRPHLARTVERFRDRPEIVAWELMNEPNCGDGGYDDDCVKTIRDWLVMASGIVRGIDRCRPVSTGLIGAGNFEIEHDSYKRIHAKGDIDLASVHRRVDEEWSDEAELAGDDAILFGEIYDRAYDEDCLPLSSGAANERADRIKNDLRDAIDSGVDGYLLWDYAAGGIARTNGEVKYYCSPFGYEADDPLWDKLRDSGLPPPVPWRPLGLR